MTAEAFAPAKVNLCLHVTGRRADGYHLLDSLVVFADAGDTVAARPAESWSLTVDGPFAAGLSGDDNLVLRAARMTAGPAAALRLTKRLPVASGIGGGSADAAATFRALAAMDGRPVPPGTEALGADVPVCLAGRPTRMSGIGERLISVPDLPAAHLVLVNPGRPLSTPNVFTALTCTDNGPLPALRVWRDTADLAAWLATTRNDLEAPARMLEPAVGAALSRIAATPGCLLARMSGSGATCFGLYASAPEARAAAAALAHPGWWVTDAAIRP